MSLIVKVAARHKAAATVIIYLANNKNHHHDQRLITGSVHYPGPLDDGLVAQVAADLDAYQKMTGVQTKRGHIYHVALSASSDNAPISDATWAGIANDYMQEMGFTGPDQSPVRWTAVNHGANAAGADHIHIVMSTVRQNGTQVNLHNDMRRASKIATRLERKYGLGVLQTRLAVGGAGSVPFTGREVNQARLEGRPEPDRVTLERKVRLAAAASATESEFVERLGKAGIHARPFPQGDGEVTGYSVRMKPGAQAFGGGKLAKDLTLPQLRRRWPEQDATPAWRGQTQGSNALTLEPDPLSVQQVLDGLTELGEQIQAATPEEFADLSHDLSATLAAVSEGTEDVPGELAGASREVGAWAQPEALSKTQRYHPGANAIVVMCRALDRSGSVQRAVMVTEVAQAVMALHRLHRASRPLAAQKGMAMATSNPLVAGATAVSRLTQDWAEQRLKDRQGAQVYRERVAAAPDTGPQYWDARDIRASRLVDKAMKAAEKTRAELEKSAPRVSDLQLNELEALAPRAGIEFKREQFDKLPAYEMDRLIETLRSMPPPVQSPLLPDTGVKLPTGLKDVRTPEDADAFLRHLERKHGAKLDAEGVAEVSNVTNLPPAPATVKTTEMTGAKDPRNWPTAADSVTKRQAFTLKAAGLTTDQVAILNKGEASFVIGSRDARAAFEENARTSPFRQPEAPVAAAPVLPVPKPGTVAAVTPTAAFPVAPGAEKFNAAVRPKPGLAQ